MTAREGLQICKAASSVLRNPVAKTFEPVTESVIKAGRVVFFIPLLVMACVLGGCFEYPISIAVMIGVLLVCGVVAWFVLRSIRKKEKTTEYFPDEEKSGLPPGTLLWIAYLLFLILGTGLAIVLWGR